MARSPGHILIVGTGFAGLGMGIRLKQAGLDDFTILEQADHVGGTWRDNHYPGAACDIESHLYSFSFEPNPNWTRTYASQPEILAYLDHCADKYGLRPHIRLGTAATGASFDEREGLWRVTTSTGDTITARVLIPCCGGLSRPAYPDIAGLGDFAGKIFHSARWDDGAPLDGKTVAVIGTGASAIQIVPAIAPRVARLDLYQRTPPWILPRFERDIAPGERARFRRFPVLQRVARTAQYLRHELFAVGFVVEPRVLRFASRFALRHLASGVADPALRQRLTPHYTMGCKRVLLSNDYYPAVARDNVTLVTDGIERVTARGIRTRDGVERAVDAIVLATGFEAAEQAAPFAVRGREGHTLDEAWKDGPEAYLGTAVSGFPNLFLIVGPNTGLGHSSMVFMIESQIAYVMDAIRTLGAEQLKLVDLRAAAQKRYNDELAERLAKTVWATGGCSSWYRTRSGRNTTLWPGFTVEFRMRTRRFDAESYECVR